MSLNIYNLFKKFAFSLDPEFIHENSMKLLSLSPGLVSSVFGQKKVALKYSCRVGSQIWTFPIGLAAGLDKNAAAIKFFSNLYFGAVEVGTVTPLSQEGNERPRLFRLKEEESLRNRMGFNNHGMDEVLNNITKSLPTGKVLGVNLGKNKLTPNSEFYKDYVLLYKQFAAVSNYLVVNVSSPNTPGLRELQGKEFLMRLFEHLDPLREREKVDLYIKIAPDMDQNSVQDIITVAREKKLTGIIATNTSYMPERGEGGISGKLIKGLAKNFRADLLDKMQGSGLELIGVGGVDSYSDLVAFWKAGGKVMQIYTSFIYGGPEILAEFKRGIDEDLERLKLNNLEELISYYRKDH